MKLFVENNSALFESTPALCTSVVARFPPLLLACKWTNNAAAVAAALSGANDQESKDIATKLVKGAVSYPHAIDVRIRCTAHNAGTTWKLREFFETIHKETPYNPHLQSVDFHCLPGSLWVYQLLRTDAVANQVRSNKTFLTRPLVVTDGSGGVRHTVTLPKFWWREPGITPTAALVRAAPAIWTGRKGSWHICTENSTLPLETVVSVASLDPTTRIVAMPTRQVRHCAAAAVPVASAEIFKPVAGFEHNTDLTQSLSGHQFRKSNIADFARWKAAMKTPFGSPLCHVVPVKFEDANSILMHGATTSLDQWCHRNRGVANLMGPMMRAVDQTLTEVVACCIEHDIVVPDLKLANMALLCARKGAYDVRLIDIDSIDSTAGGNASAMTYTSHELHEHKKGAAPGAHRQALTLFAAAFTMLHLYLLLASGQQYKVINKFYTGRVERALVNNAAAPGTLDLILHELMLAMADKVALQTDWAAVMRLSMSALRTTENNTGWLPYSHPQIANFPANLEFLCAARACTDDRYWFTGDGSEVRVVKEGVIEVRRWGEPPPMNVTDSGAPVQLYVKDTTLEVLPSPSGRHQPIAKSIDTVRVVRPL